MSTAALSIRHDPSTGDIGGGSYQRSMAMNGAKPEPVATPCGAPSAAVALFRSLGDPARLAILRRLAEGEARVTDLVTCLGLAQSTVSAHLSCLRDCEITSSRSAANIPDPIPRGGACAQSAHIGFQLRLS